MKEFQEKNIEKLLKKDPLNEKHNLFKMCQLSIISLNELWRQLEKAELTNEQFVLDWLDELNEISIRN